MINGTITSEIFHFIYQCFIFTVVTITEGRLFWFLVHDKKTSCVTGRRVYGRQIFSASRISLFQWHHENVNILSDSSSALSNFDRLERARATGLIRLPQMELFQALSTWGFALFMKALWPWWEFCPYFLLFSCTSPPRHISQPAWYLVMLEWPKSRLRCPRFSNLTSVRKSLITFVTMSRPDPPITFSPDENYSLFCPACPIDRLILPIIINPFNQFHVCQNYRSTRF